MSKTRKVRERRRYAKVKPERPPRRPRWERKDCRMCGQPVIMAEEQLGGGRLRGALLDAVPGPLGVLVRDGDGYATRDYDRAADGERWLWHDCPERSPR